MPRSFSQLGTTEELTNSRNMDQLVSEQSSLISIADEYKETD